MPSSVAPGRISDQTWEEIRKEFTLPGLEQVRRRLSELTEDPESLMQQLVRVIDDGTFCPGFLFLPGSRLHPTVVGLFQRAMELNIPHNYFTVWMITPARDLFGGNHRNEYGGTGSWAQRSLGLRERVVPTGRQWSPLLSSVIRDIAKRADLVRTLEAV
jgi:hypothetical protein